MVGRKPFAFVLMPFDSAFEDVYKLGIKAACEAGGAYCERVDEQMYEEQTLERIYNQIQKADILVADMTGRNANVFYEVGYAHGLGKNVVMLTKNGEDIPFDLRHFPHIIYGTSISNLKTELEKKIHWLVQNPAGERTFFQTALELLYENSLVVPSTTVALQHSKTGPISCEFNIHNSTKKLIEPLVFRIGLVIAKGLSLFRFLDSNKDIGVVSRYPEDQQRYLYGIDHSFQLLPGEWDRFELYFRREVISKLGIYDAAFRAFTETGTIDFPFVFRITTDSVSAGA